MFRERAVTRSLPGIQKCTFSSREKGRRKEKGSSAAEYAKVKEVLDLIYSNYVLGVGMAVKGLAALVFTPAGLDEIFTRDENAQSMRAAFSEKSCYMERRGELV